MSPPRRTIHLQLLCALLHFCWSNVIPFLIATLISTQTIIPVIHFLFRYEKANNCGLVPSFSQFLTFSQSLCFKTAIHLLFFIITLQGETLKLVFVFIAFPLLRGVWLIWFQFRALSLKNVFWLGVISLCKCDQLSWSGSF